MISDEIILWNMARDITDVSEKFELLFRFCLNNFNKLHLYTTYLTWTWKVKHECVVLTNGVESI